MIFAIEPVVVAHRGASGTAPENTITALRRAMAMGATWAEVDVQRTSDGVLVLVHDDTWERTAGVAGAIAATPWEQVRRFDAGAWFDPAFAGERPPTLEQALELARDGLQFDLEIKSPENHPGLAADIVAAVRRAGVASRVLLSCFDPDVIDEVANEAPDIAVAYLAGVPIERRHSRVTTYVFDHTVVIGSPEYIARLRARGARIWTYTVNEADIARAVTAGGATAIITNYPERFLAAGGRGGMVST
jgi:glycerophosphoryl diester phosphodiesterase